MKAPASRAGEDAQAVGLAQTAQQGAKRGLFGRVPNLLWVALAGQAVSVRANAPAVSQRRSSQQSIRRRFHFDIEFDFHYQQV
jgi:hypothetical protein